MRLMAMPIPIWICTDSLLATRQHTHNAQRAQDHRNTDHGQSQQRRRADDARHDTPTQQRGGFGANLSGASGTCPSTEYGRGVGRDFVGDGHAAACDDALDADSFDYDDGCAGCGRGGVGILHAGLGIEVTEKRVRREGDG